MKWIEPRDRTHYLSCLLDRLKWVPSWWGLASADDMRRGKWQCRYERDGNGRLKP